MPPESAFNDHRILTYSFEQFIKAENLDEIPGGRISQRGMGRYTLCGECNSNTGSWFVPAYAEWAVQAMRILMATKGATSLTCVFHIYPFRILKQVACMFFSANSSEFRLAYPDLVRFVLNKELVAFPRNIKIYAFCTLSKRLRRSGVSVIGKGFGSGHSTFHSFSEIAFPPFGFVMTLNNDPPPEQGFYEISGWAAFPYMERRDDITMRLPVMPIFGKSSR